MNLSHFRTRVRIIRAWRGLAVGGTVAGALALTWSLLDYFRIFYTNWLMLGALLCAGAVVGFLAGALIPINEKSLATSIDRRANLEDRLSTSLSTVQSSNFAEVQREDAHLKLATVKPSQIYPVRVSRWHGALLLTSLLASVLFALGNSPIFLNEEKKREKAELQKTAVAVERVAKPLTDAPNKTAQEQELNAKLEQYRSELQKGRLNKQEALQQANDLSKQADELSKSRTQQADQDIATAQSELEKMQQTELQKAGFGKIDPSLLRQTKDELKTRQSTLQKQMDDLQKQLSSGKNDSGKALTEEARKALEANLKELQDLQLQLKLSQEAKDFLDRLNSNPEWKEIQQMMEKLSAEMSESGQAMSPSKLKLSKAELEKMARELEKKIDELAKRLKDPAELKKFLDALKEAIKNMKMAGMCNKLGFCIGGLFGLSMYGTPGPGDGNEQYFADTHQIPLSKTSTDIKAKALPIGVTGDRAEQGTETYIETRGPTGLGAKSKTPYFKVLPQFRKRAEQALNREQIASEDQKRVRDYFNSLEGGK